MTLLNGAKPDGSLSQESVEVMNKNFSLEISYPSYGIKKSLLFHPNYDVVYRVILCLFLKIKKKDDALKFICKSYQERGGNLNFRALISLFTNLFLFLDANINGVSVSVSRGHFSPAIDEDVMMATLSLVDEDEKGMWPTVAEVKAMKKADVSLDLIFKRKLVNKKRLSFAPNVSLAQHLKEASRREKGFCSNREA